MWSFLLPIKVNKLEKRRALRSYTIVMDMEEEETEVFVEKRADVAPYQFEPEKSNGQEETGRPTAPLISSRKDSRYHKLVSKLMISLSSHPI